MTEPANRDALPRERSGGRWQFGMAALLGTLMLLCVPFALWGAVLRANEADQFWLMMLVAAAPLGVMMLVAFSVSVRRLLRNRQSRRTPMDDERWA